MNDEPETTPYESQLPEGWQRFVAHVVEHGFKVGRRAPEDFIRHFPPSAIMAGLEGEPERRANILVICTGVRMKIALKKTAESSATDLQIALDEDVTDAETIVTLFDPDDRVLYLDSQKLWDYVTEGEFWSGDDASSQEHVAYMLRRGLQDGLLTHREIVEGITTEKIAELLPREELGKVIAGALAAGHDGEPFSEARMLELVPVRTLVENIPLADIWSGVIAPEIAERHGLAAATDAPEVDEADEADDEARDAEVDDAQAEDEASTAEAEEASPQKVVVKPPAKAELRDDEDEGDLDMDIDDVLGLDDDEEEDDTKVVSA